MSAFSYRWAPDSNVLREQIGSTGASLKKVPEADRQQSGNGFKNVPGTDKTVRLKETSAP